MLVRRTGLAVVRWLLSMARRCRASMQSLRIRTSRRVNVRKRFEIMAANLNRAKSLKRERGRCLIDPKSNPAVRRMCAHSMCTQLIICEISIFFGHRLVAGLGDNVVSTGIEALRVWTARLIIAVALRVAIHCVYPNWLWWVRINLVSLPSARLVDYILGV